jgi:hypothetical protein
MPLQGTLSTMSVPELLMWISQYQKTGTLEITTRTTVVKMAFENGHLIFSSSSNPKATLGRLLMDNGVVSEEAHQQARHLRKTKSIAVAKAFLDMHVLTEEELVRYLRKKAEKELFDIAEVVEGEFAFRERDLPALDLLPMRVDVSRMLLRVTQDRDEKGEYDFDATGIRLEIPRDI